MNECLTESWVEQVTLLQPNAKKLLTIILEYRDDIGHLQLHILHSRIWHSIEIRYKRRTEFRVLADTTNNDKFTTIKKRTISKSNPNAFKL